MPGQWQLLMPDPLLLMMFLIHVRTFGRVLLCPGDAGFMTKEDTDDVMDDISEDSLMDSFMPFLANQTLHQQQNWTAAQLGGLIILHCQILPLVF